MAVLPPSTGTIAPRMKLAWSIARNTITSAISLGSAGRPVGACPASCFSASPATLDELSQRYNISRERVRQIEVSAFEKVRIAAQDAARRGALTPVTHRSSL